MNIDLVIALAVLGISSLVLHYKSHVKFVALGVFIGLVLLETISIQDYIPDTTTSSVISIGFLLIPALVLGINHTVDKRKDNILWTSLFVVGFTLFFLSSLAQLLPEQYSLIIREQSLIGWQALTGYYEWYTLAAAVLILIDSIHHRHHAEKEKKKKKAKSKSSSS